MRRQDLPNGLESNRLQIRSQGHGGLLVLAMSNISYLVLFAVALGATLLFVPLASKLAWATGAVDKPSRRRINKRTTPRMGGVAIFIALIASVMVEMVGTNSWAWHQAPGPYSIVSVDYSMLCAAFLIIFATGVLDDIFQLKPLQKLAGQILAAVVAAAGGLVIGRIVNPFAAFFTTGALAAPELMLGWAAFPLTVLYLVAYVNIINLIDGLDGLASGITCIAALTMFVLARAAGRLDAAALSISLVGATLGFLRYNFNPASIFLGDSGSLLLGFALGTVSLLNVTRVAGLTTMIVPLVVAGIPIIDTASAIIRRKRAHVSVGTADKGHIHHRLIQSGFDQKQAVLLIYAWTALLCAGAIIMTKVTLHPRIVIFILLLVASAIFARRLHLLEPVLLHHYDPTTGSDTLVDPSDPAFKQEAAHQHERASKHHPHLHHPAEKNKKS